MVEDKKPLVDEETADKSDKFNKFKAKGKGFKSNRRQRRSAKGVPTKGGNDFDFWNQYPELMGIATRFPWMHIAGTPLTGENVTARLANVAVQHYFSVPGKSGTATDPINLAFRQVYLDMHRKYRGIGAYQASDIGIAMICIESVLQLIVEMERVYGILKGYPIKSRIEPEGLLSAMGYTAQFITDVKSHMADFRYSINRLISLARRLPLPSGMNFFRNHVALNAFTYKDSQDERASILVFVFDNYYRWQTTINPGCINSASTALSVPFDRGTFTAYSAVISLIETELTNLLTDSDVLRITSDFIACYGENNMQVLMELPEDYTVAAQYSESILHKWHNSERAGTVATANDPKISYIAVGNSTTKLPNGEFAVYQVNDIIMSLPVLVETGGQPAWKDTGNNQYVYGEEGISPINEAQSLVGHIADSWEAEPSQEHVCEAMLWRICVSVRKVNKTGSPEIGAEFKYICTEILGNLDVFAVSNSGVSTGYAYESTLAALCSDDITYGLSKFDWHPLLLRITPGTLGSYVDNIQGDVDNVTTVSADVISKVVDAACLSAFKINISGSGSREQ